jgi:ribosomal-protein-alanine N-acetyltransferase
MNPQQQEQLRVHIRWMIRRDMAEVLRIESEGFEFPWSEDDFIRCLRQRNCIGMVAEHDDRVIGFMIYELHRTRLHLLNFAVSGELHRRRVGTQMLAKLLAKLSSQRRTRIALEVRETNLAAQLFFRSLGFRAVSVLRDFYEDTTEDAYLMQYRYRPVETEVIIPINRITKLAG